jgi:D-serine deaminase-like pyridoxal phosphate-dependent protein
MNITDCPDLEGARSLIGRTREELPTPVMLLDLGVAARNIAFMAKRLSGAAGLRPHCKSHKCAELAKLQIEAGAIGLTAATAWEAVAFANRGFEDLLIANEVVGQDKLDHLAAAARKARITVAVDDATNAAELARAARRAKTEFGVLVDVDVGMGRCGVRSPEEALGVAQAVARLPGLRLRGVMGYEGHCMHELDKKARCAKASAAMNRLMGVVGSLAAAGWPAEIVSAGGTATSDCTGRFDGVTEIQAGSYVLMDNARSATAPEFEIALSVLATVISRHGSTIVIDAGRKTVGLEVAAPRLLGLAASHRKAGDEHLIFELGEERPLRVGDRVEVVAGYVPTTINLHDFFLVMEAGRVADVWPVLAPRAGRPWAL